MAKDDEKHSDLSEAARKLGHKGGLAGGPARDQALSASEKQEIARLGSKARWSKAIHEHKKKTKGKKGKGGGK